ncbi:MAG: insulinase family protein [Desulfurivibrio sp.]|nr:insulinase family protein [Desulfurivibrio sp.]
MKGDSSSPISMLFERMNEALYPTTTYHYNSGGDPAHIPDLSYEQLVAFYRTHYHPTNSVFMTFGDIPAEEQQALMDERALSHFDRLPTRVDVGRGERFTEPRVVEADYGVPVDEELTGKTHIVLGWLLGDNTDLELLLRLNLLSDALLDTAASPLRHALESSPHAGAISPCAASKRRVAR